MIESWEQHNELFVRPHRVLINPYDPEKHVWLVDDGAHMIYKFTNDGKKLVMTLGEFKVEGNDEKHFGRPTDIAWLPDGTFFVSDGYTNTRVVKFDKNGKFLMTWGQKGNQPNETRPGYMNTVHAIAIDKKRRVYISRSRQLAHPGVRRERQVPRRVAEHPPALLPCTCQTTSTCGSADGITQKFLKFDLNGKLLYSWGTFGAFPGGFWGVHQFSVDSEGNLYTADVHVGRPQKFTPKAGADPKTLVGRAMPSVATSF